MGPATSTSSVSLERDGAHAVRGLGRAQGELNHLVRALAHDMSANFMLLEDSFGQLRLVLGEAPREELQQLADHVEACLDQSRGLLDDLVRLGKTGSVEMESQRVELSGVVEEVLFELHQRLDRRGIIASVQQPLPAVWCNRQRVKQILLNLLGNAIRHGCDPLSPRVTIRAAVEDSADSGADPQPAVVLRVHDNGRGIAAADAESVFLAGRRLATACEGGWGMGLAIVRKIAEHYGGRAWLDLGDSSGTTVCVRLPGDPARSVGAGLRHPNPDHDSGPLGDPPHPYRPHARHSGRRDRLTRP